MKPGPLGWVAQPWTMPPLLWHAHEMVYGFAVAVIVGFLLTAGKAWTGLDGPGDAAWCHPGRDGGAVGRSAASSRVGAVPVYVLLDVALLPWVAVVLIRVLLKAGNRRKLRCPGHRPVAALRSRAPMSPVVTTARNRIEHRLAEQKR